MRWLKRHFEMVSLSEAQARVNRGSNQRACVTITFDDGYADNCRFALPLLIKERIPCTYFVASEYVLMGTPFPHDVAAGRPLSPNTPDQIREISEAGIEIGAHTRTHASLGARCDRAQLSGEIVGSKQDLEEIIDAPVRHFAFPYGQHANLSAQAFEIARTVGFETACSAYGAAVAPPAPTSAPAVSVLVPDLAGYDQLLTHLGAAA
jgi:peptidoglycan/xylan/chitin deacetylase (PgdA/CDA1 family)